MQFIELLKFELDRCSPGGVNICRNGGNCSIGEYGEINCECDARFEGTLCQIGKLLLIKYHDWKVYNNDSIIWSPHQTSD